ncbi:MAG: hypothetical protein NT088_02985 [Candidatus Omnitrophica bacterium]|nr:hypothetical protein [Candidatus Omnitrophota bacterium]
MVVGAVRLFINVHNVVLKDVRQKDALVKTLEVEINARNAIDTMAICLRLDNKVSDVKKNYKTRGNID